MSKEKPIPNKAAVDKSLAACLEFMRANGLKSFLLLFQPVEGLNMTHMENITVRTALSVLITGLDQTIKVELARASGYSKEYKAALEQFLADLKIAVVNTNQRLDKFNPDGSEMGKA